MVELWHIHSEKYYTASENNVAELNLSTQKDLRYVSVWGRKMLSMQICAQKNVWKDIYQGVSTLATREMQIKILMSYCLIPIR